MFRPSGGAPVKMPTTAFLHVVDQHPCLLCSLLPLVHQALELGLLEQAGCFCHFVPIIRIRLDKVSNLLHHTQAHFAQVLAVVEDEVQDVLLLLLRELEAGQHAVTHHLLDPQQLVAHGSNLQIQVVTARHDGRQVRRNARLTGNRRFEVNVAQEQDRRFEVERFGDVVVKQRPRLLVPVDATLVPRVQRSLEQGDLLFFEQHAVAVIEHQHTTLGAIEVQLLVQADARHAAADHFICGFLTAHSQEHVGRFQLLFDAKALSNTGRARHNQTAHSALGRCIGDLVEHGKGAANALHGFFFGFGLQEELLVLRRRGERATLLIARCNDNVFAEFFSGSIQQLEAVSIAGDSLHRRMAIFGCAVLDSDKPTASTSLERLDQREDARYQLAAVIALDDLHLDRQNVPLC